MSEIETEKAASQQENNDLATKWSNGIKAIHKPINSVLVAVAKKSAAFPRTTIGITIVLSVLMLVTGLFTNFSVDVNDDLLWSPRGSRPASHYHWIEDESGFPASPRSMVLTVHMNGDNVLGQEGIARVFKALNTVRETEGYDDLCQNHGEAKAADGAPTCRIVSPTTFWNESEAVFNQEVASDSDAILALSQDKYPDGGPVDHESIMGKPVFDETNYLTNAEVFLVQIDLPDVDETESFEADALDRVLDLQDEWEKEAGNSFRVEVIAERSFSDEFTRAIVNDIPLVPIVFIVMSVFTALIFFKRDRVKSRMLLGFGAVVSVLLSIMTGYGLMFVCGVPFTSMTQILPFVMFGIGLDDAFILSGSFYRTDSNKPISDRIEEMIRDVGISITLTTLTSSLAFALGCISTIPAVFWLCLYAFPTIVIDYIYQITFFVAILAIDEKRVNENRKDCLVCYTATTDNDDSEDTAVDSNEASVTDRVMTWYAEKLLKPWVKVAVVISFLGMLGGFAYSASQLTQEFDFTEVIPSDSYITPFFDVLNDHTARGGIIVDIYFRDVDQSQPEIQQQMEDYVNDVVGMKQVDEQPPFFWLRDFAQYVNEHEELQGLDFYPQFDVFFNDPVYNDIYRDHIVLNENGEITSSRTTIFMNNVDDVIVTELIEALEDQRAVSRKQPINDGKSDWSFFTYTGQYLIFEFYSVAVDELVLTTILGVVSVSVLALVLMPHWTAIIFVAPLICVLYVDLLGVLQLAGVHINPVSYIAMVMSIGLLVDFIVHVLLRYFELEGDRVTRTKEMLRTMGSSVLIGGVSTFLGVIPLAFSTSVIFQTIFTTFLGLVTLGMGHGLILLPVILSTVGPEDKKPEVARDIATTAHDDASV